jgi:hypothetical protein
MRHPFNGQVGQLGIKAFTISMPVSNISCQQGAKNGTYTMEIFTDETTCGVLTMESFLQKYYRDIFPDS